MSRMSHDSLFSESYSVTSSEHNIENSSAVRIRNLIKIATTFEHVLAQMEKEVNNNDHISAVNNNSEIQEFSATNDVDEERYSTSSNGHSTSPSRDEIYQKHSIMLSNKENARAQSMFLVESWIHSTHDVNIWASEKPTEKSPSEMNEALSILHKHHQNNPWFYDTTDRCISLLTYGKVQHSLVQQYYQQSQLWPSDNEDDESDDIFEAKRTNEVRHRSSIKKLMRRIQFAGRSQG